MLPPSLGASPRDVLSFVAVGIHHAFSCPWTGALNRLTGGQSAQGDEQTPGARAGDGFPGMPETLKQRLKAMSQQEGERNLMKTGTPKTMQLGELIAAAFDKAAQQSSDPREISRLATMAVQRMLRRARKTSSPISTPTTSSKIRDAFSWRHIVKICPTSQPPNRT